MIEGFCIVTPDTGTGRIDRGNDDFFAPSTVVTVIVTLPCFKAVTSPAVDTDAIVAFELVKVVALSVAFAG